MSNGSYHPTEKGENMSQKEPCDMSQNMIVCDNKTIATLWMINCKYD